MLWHANHGVYYSPDGDGAGGAAAAAAAAAPGGAAPAPVGGAAAATVWHTGIDADVLGIANSKGWKLDDPKIALGYAARAYKEAETLRGVPVDELVRKPKANAAPEDIKKFRQSLGVPAEAKDYDLSGLKFGGADLEEGFAAAARNGLLEAGVTKDNASAALKPIIKWLEDTDTAEKAVTAAKVTKEKEDLDRSWAANKDKNEHIAKSYFLKLAKGAGYSDQEALINWDAISKAPGSTIGAAGALKMLLYGGIQTGEDRYVGGGGGGQNMPLSREGALARIDALKKDKEFTNKLLKQDVLAKEEWHGLHVIAHSPSRAA